MKQIFEQVLLLCAQYWWVIAAALVIVNLIPAKNGVEEAIDSFDPQNSHGAAAFAFANKLFKKAGLFSNGIHIGYSPDGKHKLFYSGVGHIFLCAPARAGKAVTILVNALLELWTSAKNRREISGVIVFDPKAELTAICGHWMARFGKVFVLNPYNMFPKELRGLKQAGFNPMDLLDPDSLSFHAVADKIAASVVREEEGKNRYFSDSSCDLISGIETTLVRHEEPAKRTLVEVARIIGSGDGLFRFCRNAMKSSDPDIVRKLRRFAITPTPKNPVPDEMRAVIATAITNLSFIRGGIAKSLQQSDVRFSDLKRRKGTTIFACLPLATLDVDDKYFRLLMDCLLADLLAEGGGSASGRVLAVVDETALMGPHMKGFENALGMGAGAAGLQIVCVFQNWAQAVGMLGKTATTFIQNSGVSMWLSARDTETRDMVSKLSGVTELRSRSRNVSVDRISGEVMVSESVNQFGRPLVLPHEAGELAPDEMLLLVEGINGPIKAKRKKYFEIAEYKGRYRANPYFKKR